MRVVCWWSAGVTSAVATYYAIEMFGAENVDIYYSETGACHPDNARFILECERWYGKTIMHHQSSRYKSPVDVATKKRFIAGPMGNPCTLELKKKPRYFVEDTRKKECFTKIPDEYDHSVWGFEDSPKEIKRAEAFAIEYPDLKPFFPLIEKNIDKPNALYILEKKAGIRRPRMYELGFPNNNCIGCLKANGFGYWRLIKEIAYSDMPEAAQFREIFEATAKLEREIGRTVIRAFPLGKRKGEREQYYLDELPMDRGRDLKPIVPECGAVCQLEFDEFADIGERNQLSFNWEESC